VSAHEQVASLDERAVGGTSSSVMAMILFVASEAMFFMAFFGIYTAAQAGQRAWPPLSIPLPAMGLPTAGAVVLGLSAIPMALLVHAVRRRGGKGVGAWLLLTAALGAAFCVLQLAGYSKLGFGIHDGIYASLFYIMTGLGLAHVVGGLVFVGLVTQQALAGELALRRDPAEALAIYWFFVVLLGLALYAAFYAGVAG
jgi:cytochrome c oxidase subunit III